MSLTQIIVLALVQGITEFLPISSQAHLILVPRLTGWCDQGLLIDLAVHIGTLGAVVLYFWRECLGMGCGALNLARGKPTAEGRLFLLVILATLPTLAAGYGIKTLIGSNFRSVEMIAWATLGFGVVLWAADKWGLRIRRIEHMTWVSALAIGLSQALALIPGTSRSGITMATARLLGFERVEAARFSLLMAIPVTLAAGALGALDVIEARSAALTHDAVLAGVLSFFAALAAIALMMGWLRRATFAPFVVYRIVLGLLLLAAVHFYGFTDTAATAACQM